jgi:hypothetical protein
VISTEFESSSAAFVRWDGEVVRPHVISSGSADAGLSTALSGDVVAPTMASPAPGTTDAFVLVDRYPASVLTWVDVATGAPTRQLSLRTGFDSNLQDYVAVSATKGYASRYDPNPAPGREPFDGGSDLLVIDPRAGAIVARVGFEAALGGDADRLLARPSRLVLDGGRLVVLLAVLERNFSPTGDSRVAVIDTDTDRIVAVHRVDGLRNCNALAVAPGGGRVAVGCTGTIPLDGEAPLDGGGVAVVDVQDGTVLARIDDDAFGAPPGFSIAFAADDALLVPTFGWKAFDDAQLGADDAVHHVPLDGRPPEALLTGEAFQLGEVRCAPCGTCLVADAGRGVLHRLVPAAEGAPTGGGMTIAGEVRIDDGLGLPPRYLGALPRGQAVDDPAR